MASSLRVNLELELAKIRDFEFSRPRRDPDATFRTWLRTAAERASRPSNARPADTAADNTKRAFERARASREAFEARKAAGDGAT